MAYSRSSAYYAKNIVKYFNLKIFFNKKRNASNEKNAI